MSEQNRKGQAVAADGPTQRRGARARPALYLDRRTRASELLIGFGTWEWDIAADRMAWSPHLYDVFGVTRRLFTPTFEGCLAMVHPDDRTEVERTITEALATGAPFELTHRIRSDGVTRWMNVHGRLLMNAAGEPAVMYGTAMDVTRIHTIAEEAERRAAVERVVFEHMSDLVIACDGEGGVVALNRAMQAATGHGPIALDDRPHFTDVLRYRTVEGGAGEDGRPLARALRGETVVDSEEIFINADGAELVLVVSSQGFRDSDGTRMGAVAVAQDVTEQRRAAKQLASVAEHDTLTGLLHPSVFVTRLDAALTLAQRRSWMTAVLAVDVDDIGIELGHIDGGDDAVIAKVGSVIVEQVDQYRPDQFRGESAARSSGGRFLVYCEGVPTEAAAVAVAKRIQLGIADAFAVPETGIAVTASIGVVVSRERSGSAQSLADAAVIAASRARDRGPGEIELFRREGGTVDGADRRGDGLQRALENGEFFLEYQPKLSLSSGRTTGVEALLRWNDPKRGRIAPLDFIPIAEATGQIKPIGAWVMRTACEAAMRWATCFPELGELVVAVNVSSRQFDDTLAAVVDDALTATGLDPKRLCIEITESAVMENADAAIVTLQHIKALGVRISIDDFGTGYSSLAYLRRFPIDELKIDRTFVEGLGTDPEATAITAAIMGMAHALGLSTVAEGVETELQERALRNLGCDETQGYLRCRPVAGPDLEMFLTQGAHGGDDGRIVTVPTAVVIDDLGEVRQLVRSSLSSAGFIVHEADRGDDGLELVRRLRPDCVLLDVNMPGKNGLEVCRILRADSLTSGTTIIMLTTDNRSGDKVAAYVMDADDYIVKPFAPRDLVARVNMAIRRRRSGL